MTSEQEEKLVVALESIAKSLARISGTDGAEEMGQLDAIATGLGFDDLSAHAPILPEVLGNIHGELERIADNIDRSNNGDI